MDMVRVKYHGKGPHPYRGHDASSKRPDKTLTLAPGETGETGVLNAERLVREHAKGEFEIVGKVRTEETAGKAS